MALLRARNAAVLAKIETTEGVFVSPSSSTDGILGENLTLDFNPQNVNTDEFTGSLDGRGPIVGGLQCGISFDAYLKGNGVPGTVPEWDELLQICGWSSTATKTDIGPITTAAITGTNTLTDSASGLAAATAGTVIYISGFANAANNGEFLVSTSAAGSLGLTKIDGSAPGMTNETAGASVTIRRGIVGTAATAGTTTTFTAQAPWGNSGQDYRGMPVLLSGNPATPAYAFISDYPASRVATLTDLFSALTTSTKASVPANVLYKPISISIPSGSFETYIDGVKYQFAGVRGSVSFAFAAAGACKASLKLMGMYIGKSDAAVPTPSYDGTRPGIFRNSKMLVNRLATALRTLSLDTGAQTQFPSDPNQVEGFSPPQITDRNMSGSMDPYATLVATRDIMSVFRAGTQQIVHGRVLGGNAANVGQRIGITIPAAMYTGYKPGADGQLATEQVDFFPFGQDSGAFLCLY